MATAAPQPGSVEFLHYFVQQGTAGGQVSVLKGTTAGHNVVSGVQTGNSLRVMFRCLLPQNNEYRHVIISMRPKIDILERDQAITFIFSISNRIDGTYGRLNRIRPVWATGHAPAAAEVDTFEKAFKVMGERLNGLMEVEAVELQCAHCDQKDPHEMYRLSEPTRGYFYVCKPCREEYYEVVTEDTAAEHEQA